MKRENISISVIRRLPRYYRFLQEMLGKGIERTSSKELSERMGLTASQIRQDLNCFGGFGQQGYGYNINMLYHEIGHIIGTDNPQNIVLIGAGHLGSAIATHMDFASHGFCLVGIFDSDKRKTGTMVAGVPVMHSSELPAFCQKKHPSAAILCIPKSGAQEMADQLIELSIHAFWNFSHYDLRTKHENIVVENVHLGDSLLTLRYQNNHMECESNE